MTDSHGPLDREQAERATAEIQSELDQLERIANLPTALHEVIIIGNPLTRDYKAFWQKAKEISDLFRSSRIFQRERQSLWGRYHNLCERVRNIQTREREEREEKSRQNKDLILTVIKDAHNCASGAEESEHFYQARSFLNQVLELLKEKFLLKKDRQACWQAWQEANSKLFHTRNWVRDLNYNHIEGEIGRIASEAVHGNPYEALKMIKGIQCEIKKRALSSDQRTLLRKMLQGWWGKAVTRVEESRREKEQKHQEWQERMMGKLLRITELIEKNEGVINRLREQIDDLEEKITNAWNEDWAETARGWVEEKYEKIRAIEETNAALEVKINDIREKLGK